MTLDRYFELRGLSHETLNTHYLADKIVYLYKVSDSTLQHPYYIIVTTDLDGKMLNIVPYIMDEVEARAKFSDFE